MEKTTKEEKVKFSINKGIEYEDGFFIVSSITLDKETSEVIADAEKKVKSSDGELYVFAEVKRESTRKALAKEVLKNSSKLKVELSDNIGFGVCDECGTVKNIGHGCNFSFNDKLSEWHCKDCQENHEVSGYE